MASITLQGNTINTSGELPAVGTAAPDFVLSNHELKDYRLADLGGKWKLLNIVPSVDTPTCALSTKRFNDEARGRDDLIVLTVSADLPFALGRFCEAESIDKVLAVGMMRDRSFADDYGVRIVDGPLAGITARAVVLLDGDNVVRYTELVGEIADEPDYQRALAAIEG